MGLWGISKCIFNKFEFLIIKVFFFNVGMGSLLRIF